MPSRRTLVVVKDVLQTKTRVNTHRHDRLSRSSVQGLCPPQRGQGRGKVQTLSRIMPLLLHKYKHIQYKFTLFLFLAKCKLCETQTNKAQNTSFFVFHVWRQHKKQFTRTNDF